VVCALALLATALLALSCGQSKLSAGPQGDGRVPAASSTVQDETPTHRGTARAAGTGHRAAEPSAVSAAVSVEGSAKTYAEVSGETSGDASGSPSCSKRDGGNDAQIRPGTGTGESAVAPGDRNRSVPVAPDARSPKVLGSGLLIHPLPSFTVLRI